MSFFFRDTCDVCRGRVRNPTVVLGRRYCDRCASEAVRVAGAGPGTPHPNEGPTATRRLHATERRTFPRFRPPPGTTLVIKPFRGLSRFFGGNLVREWLDVSLGGLRVILSRGCSEGDSFRARILYERFRDAFNVDLVVSHVTPSKKHAGCFVAGLEFVNPTGSLRTFLTNSQPQPKDAALGPGGA